MLWATPAGNRHSTAIAAMDGRGRPSRRPAGKLKAGCARGRRRHRPGGFAAVVVSSLLGGSFSSITSPQAPRRPDHSPARAAGHGRGSRSGEHSPRHRHHQGWEVAGGSGRPAEHRAFVTNSDSNSVSVIDTTGNLVILCRGRDVASRCRGGPADPSPTTNGSTFMVPTWSYSTIL